MRRHHFSIAVQSLIVWLSFCCSMGFCEEENLTYEDVKNQIIKEDERRGSEATSSSSSSSSTELPTSFSSSEYSTTFKDKDKTRASSMKRGLFLTTNKGIKSKIGGGSGGLGAHSSSSSSYGGSKHNSYFSSSGFGDLGHSLPSNVDEGGYGSSALGGVGGGAYLPPSASASSQGHGGGFIQHSSSLTPSSAVSASGVGFAQGHGHGHSHGNEYGGIYGIGGHGYGQGHIGVGGGHNQWAWKKGLLIPLAGIALIGAAAALTTNPVLLQLGVLNGKRKRRRRRRRRSINSKNTT